MQSLTKRPWNKQENNIMPKLISKRVGKQLV